MIQQICVLLPESSLNVLNILTVAETPSARMAQKVTPPRVIVPNTSMPVLYICAPTETVSVSAMNLGICRPLTGFPYRHFKCQSCGWSLGQITYIPEDHCLRVTEYPRPPGSTISARTQRSTRQLRGPLPSVLDPRQKPLKQLRVRRLQLHTPSSNHH
jgi:hypothetical protein